MPVDAIPVLVPSTSRPHIDALVIGASIKFDTPAIGGDNFAKYLGSITPGLKPKTFEWTVDGSVVTVRRGWNVSDDKWGLSGLELNAPARVKGASPASIESVRATANTLRRYSGMVIRCKTDGQSVFAMLAERLPLPAPASGATESAETLSVEEFMSMGRDRGPTRYPIDIDLGSHIILGPDEVGSPGALRAFYTYHGKKLRQKFSISALNGPNAGSFMVTRKE